MCVCVCVSVCMKFLIDEQIWILRKSDKYIMNKV